MWFHGDVVGYRGFVLGGGNWAWLPPWGIILPSGDGFLGRRHSSGDMGGRVFVVTLDIPSTSKFGHIFCPKSMGAVLKDVVFLGRINLGMDPPLGQIFCLLFFPPLRNLGIASAQSLWGGVG